MLQKGTWVSRLAAVAILILVVLAGHRFVVMPVLDRYAANERQILDMTDLLQRYRDLEAAKPALLDRLAAMQSQDEAESGYWAGASDVLTAAKLQDRAALAVEDHGGDVISMETLDRVETEEAPAIGRTALRMRLATTVEGLARTMYDIETGTPYMFIDRLIVTPQRSRQRAGGERDGLERKALDVRLDLSAYARKKSDPASVESTEAAGAEG